MLSKSSVRQYTPACQRLPSPLVARNPPPRWVSRVELICRGVPFSRSSANTRPFWKSSKLGEGEYDSRQLPVRNFDAALMSTGPLCSSLTSV